MGDRSPKSNAKAQRQKARRKEATQTSRKDLGGSGALKSTEESPGGRPNRAPPR